jgi:uncharacterized membrane protein
MPRLSAKLLTAFLICILIAIAGMVGCGSKTISDEQEIQSAVIDALSGYKDFNSETLDEFAVEMDLDKLDQFGLTGQTFLKKYFEGFDYSISDININNNQASVSVTVACKDFTEIENAISQNVSKLVEQAQAGKLTSSTMKQSYGDLILDSIDKTNLKNYSLTLTYSKDDAGIWVPVDNIGIVLAGALLGN